MILHLKDQTIDQLNKEFKEIESYLNLCYVDETKFSIDIVIKECSTKKKSKN